MRHAPILLLTAALLSVIACDQETVDVSAPADPLHWTPIGEFGSGAYYGDIWGSSEHDVYAANNEYRGLRGLIHFDGSHWTSIALPNNSGALSQVNSIWGSGPDDVYAVNLRLWHFDGSVWNDTGIGANSVSGTAANNVMAANLWTLFHFNGAEWDTLLAIDPRKGSIHQFWAGDGPAAMVDLYHERGVPDSLVRLENGAWSALEPAPGNIWAFAGASPDDIIAVGADGNNGMAWHWDGVQWTPIMNHDEWPEVTDIVMLAPDDAYAATFNDVLHYNGTTWQPMDAVGPYFWHVWASASSDVYASGHDLVHYNGSEWREAIPTEPEDPQSVWAESSGRMIVGGNGFMYELENGVWSKKSLQGEANINDIQGNDWNNLYASTGQGVFHFDGSEWTLMPDSPSDIDKLSVLSTGQIYGNAGMYFFHFDGSEWAKIKQLTSVNGADGVWAFADNDVLFGYADGILHYDGSEWTRVHDQPAFDIWASLPHDVYAVSSAHIFHSDGGAYSVVGPIVQGGMDAITGTSANHVVAAGAFGYAAWEKGRWLVETYDERQELLDLVAAKDGSILRLISSQPGEYRLAYHRD
jgi:hypothetical protein